MRRSSTLATSRPSLLALILVVGPAWLPGVALSATKHATVPNAPFAYNTSGVVGIGADPASVSGPAILQFQGLTGASFDPKSGQPIGLGQFVVTPSTATSGATTLYQGTPFEIEIQAPALDKTSTVPLLGNLFPSLDKKLSLKTLTENSLLLKGHLDGSVGADGVAHVTATVDTIKLGSLGTSSSDHVTHYTFPIRFSQLKLPSSWSMSTATTLPTNSTQTQAKSPVATTAAATSAAATATAAAQVLAGSSPAPASTATPKIAPAPAAEMVTVTTPSTSPMTPVPTPEPSTILLFATAFGGLALARRRQMAR